MPDDLGQQFLNVLGALVADGVLDRQPDGIRQDHGLLLHFLNQAISLLAHAEVAEARHEHGHGQE